MLKAQIPLGEMRLDAGAPTLTVRVWRPSVEEALAVNAPTLTQTEQGFSISFPYFVKLLWEGNILAHTVLWSPYTGEYLPREDLLCQRLVDNLRSVQGSLYHRWLCYLHACSIAEKRTLELDRKDWESLDSLKFGRYNEAAAKKLETEMREAELPVLDTPTRIYNQLISQFYAR